jgi:hypothetical protein
MENHFDPCINDKGEIIWLSYVSGIGMVITSSTRGILAIPRGFAPVDLNNFGELYLDGSLEGPPGNYTSPHVFSSTHGVIINDPERDQWDGGMNDQGEFVWTEFNRVFKAEWITIDETTPQINLIAASSGSIWPPNNRLVPVDLTVDVTDNIDPSPTVKIIQVSASDPYAVPSDWQITGPLSVNLRATQLPKGAQRIYTVSIEGRDASGNSATNAIQIKVAPERKVLR